MSLSYTDMIFYSIMHGKFGEIFEILSAIFLTIVILCCLFPPLFLVVFMVFMIFIFNKFIDTPIS